MKTPIFISLLIIFVLASASAPVFAETPPSVFHSHAGRIHQHPLPPEGVAHRHNGGAPGVIARSTNQAGSISSSVIQVGPNPGSGKPPIIIRSDTSQIQKGTDAANRYSKGDVHCRVGEADCNVCAANVQQQFKKAAAGQINWQTKPWRFNWSQQYPPYGKRPLDIFNGDPAYALGIPDTHVQGFVRTNSAQYPYAGSHSHKRQGGIFVIRQTSDGKKYLSSLHPGKSRHPSAVQVLGKYLVYAENGRLVFKDINSQNQKNDISLAIPGSNVNFGGGLGLLRLANGDHLVVASGPGGQDSRPRFHQFYRLQTDHGRPRQLKYLGDDKNIRPAKWPGILAYSENLSLITECGTGDIYTIHTTGEEKGVKMISGNGYWRLSKLNQSNQGKLELAPLNAFATRQNMTSCNIRAAATVFVNNQHKLEFYCHAYAKDPDGSLFNVLGRSSRGDDQFYFKAGIVR